MRATKKKSISYCGNLRELTRQSDQRRARFRCVVAVARNGDLLGTFEGTVEGRIADTAEATPDSATIRFSFRMDSKQTFGELPDRSEEQQSAIAQKRFAQLADRLRRL